MQQSSGDNVAPSPRFTLSRIIDRHNPGITLLVVLWTAAFALRDRLVHAGQMEQVVDDALKSLLLVIPIMLIGWGILTILDKRYRLGLFK